MNERQQKIERLGELWTARGEERAWTDEIIEGSTYLVFWDSGGEEVGCMSDADTPAYCAAPCIAIGQDVFGPSFWINRYDSGFACVHDDSYISAREPDPVDALIAAMEALP